MITKGIGLATGSDSQEVGRLVARRALEQNPKPQLGILFSSVRYDQQLLFNTIRKELGNVPIFGTTSPMLISNCGMERHAVILLLLTSPELEFKILGGKFTGEPAEIAQYLCSQYLFEKPGLTADDLVTCILAGTESHGRGIEYLQGIRNVFPFPLPVSGGASVGTFPTDDSRLLQQGYQYCGDLLANEYLALLFLRALQPDKIRFGYSYESSWQPVAHPVICTRTEKNIVYEVDHMPIMTYLKTYLGENFFENLSYTRPHFSFIARLKDHNVEKSLIRVTLSFDFTRQCVVFWPMEDMAGQEIQLIQLSRDDLLCGTEAAAKQAFTALGGYRPEMVLIFSCTVRSQLLHSWADQELEKVRKIFGDRVPIVGLYCNGEYAPLYNDYQDITNPQKNLSGSRQFGCSVSIFALGSNEEPAQNIDYRELVSRQKRDDQERAKETAPEQIQRLSKLLDDAERIITENENVLRYVINQHYKTNLSLKHKNEALLEANKRSEKLQEVIRQYTPHDVWKKASVSVLAGLYKIPDEEVHCALMFVDIKGFTSFAEHHTPEEVIAELNRIFQPATEFVYRYNGDIDKYIGDCIFAKFATPPNALLCAIEIQKMMHVMQTQGCPFLVRVGINFGRIISGNVGASMRRENALLGDAVNVAQRLESACTPGSILVSAEYLNQLDKDFATKLALQRTLVKVKGKEKELEVFEMPAASIDAFPV